MSTTLSKTTAQVSAAAAAKRRAWWMNQFRTWHWISAALCLVTLLLFSITGFTLNHAADIGAEPVTATVEAQLPEALRAKLAAGETEDRAVLPDDLRAWLATHVGVEAGGREAEWLPGEIYLELPRPGGDAWISIDLLSGDVLFERTDRGLLALLNDLHKGRDTGKPWRLFMDVFAFATVVFSVTGLLLLKMQAARRRSTWPVVAAGLALPLILMLFFMHL